MAPTNTVAGNIESGVENMSERWAWGVRLVMGSYMVVCAVGSFLTV